MKSTAESDVMLQLDEKVRLTRVGRYPRMVPKYTGTGGSMDGWINGWMNGWLDGWTAGGLYDGWMGGGMDG